MTMPGGEGFPPNEPVPRTRPQSEAGQEPQFFDFADFDDPPGGRPRYTWRDAARDDIDYTDRAFPEFTEEELAPPRRPRGRGGDGPLPPTDEDIIGGAAGRNDARRRERVRRRHEYERQQAREEMNDEEYEEWEEEFSAAREREEPVGTSSGADILARTRGRLREDPRFYTRPGSLTRAEGSITRHTSDPEYEGYVAPPGIVRGRRLVGRLEDATEVNADLREAGISLPRRLRAVFRFYRESVPTGSEVNRPGVLARARAAGRDYINGVFTRGEENGRRVTHREMLRRRVVFGLGAAALFAVTLASVKSGIDFAGAINLGTPLSEVPAPDIPAAGQDVFRGAGNVVSFFGGNEVGGNLVENAEYYEQVARGLGVTALLANATFRIGQAVRGGIRTESAADRTFREALNRDRRLLSRQDREDRREESRREGARFANAERQFWSPAAVRERTRIAAEGRQRVGRFLGRLFTVARLREYLAARRGR